VLKPIACILTPMTGRALLVAVLLATSGALQAATYRVGPSLPATETDFRDLGAFAERVKCLKVGDKVLLQRGAVLQGALHLRLCSGEAGSEGRIEVGAFDAGSGKSEAPMPATLTQAEPATGWTRLTRTQARQAALSAPDDLTLLALDTGGEDVTEVFVKDHRMLLARSPNADQGAPRFATISQIKAAGTDCPAAVCLQPHGDSVLSALTATGRRMDKDVGVYAIVRSSPWSFAYSKLQGSGTRAGELLLASAIHGSGEPATELPRPGYGFVVVNHPSLLDSHGEWYHDKSKRQLLLAWNEKANGPFDEKEAYVVRDRGKPNERTLFQGAGIAFLADAKASAQSTLAIKISDVQVQRTAGDGIRVINVPNVEIRDVGVLQPAQNGVVVHGARLGAVVANSRINGTPNNGVLVSSSSSVVVEENRISRAGQIANQERFGMDLNGIRVGGFLKVSVRKNEIDTTGYAGIMMSEAAPGVSGLPQDLAVQVRDNKIRTFCVRLNDCGAIYINGRQPGTPKATTVPGSRAVTGNEISDPRASMDGSPGALQAERSSTPNGATHRMIGAIYLDHGASGYDVANNRVDGSYEPYGWRIFNKGVLNACSRKEVEQCVANKGGYKCYSAPLEQCNRVEPRGQR
jgi:hypothetical protein